MSIFSVLGDIAKVVLKVGKIVLPIVEALRGSSHEVDQVMDQVDGVVEAGGEIADDFFDRNIEIIEDMDEFFGDLEQLGKAGKALTGAVIRASQEESPDKITPLEAEAIGDALIVMKDKAIALFENSEGLEEKIAGMK